MELVIVTGMSGTGKTRAINALEDIGYFCVDNIPPKLIQKFAELCAVQPSASLGRVAIVVDARSREMFGDFAESLEGLDAKGQSYRILYLEADDGVILRRYKETRRRHPLMDSDCDTIEKAIKTERRMLAFARSRADILVDTSLLTNAQLKERIASLFLDSAQQGMGVTILSFGFKYGLPGEADLVFDVRCLPNPFYLPELRPKTGLDQEVREYVMGFSQSQGMLQRLEDMIDYLLPYYIQEGKSQLTVAIGCTGGQHRSVTLAYLLHDHLKQAKVPVALSHRDAFRPK